MKAFFILFVGLTIFSCRKDDYSNANFGFTKTYGREQEDNAQKILEIDHELYIFGTSQTYGVGNFYLLKTDTLGNKLAEKIFETPSDENGYNMLLSSDKTLILVGTTKNSTSSDVLVKKVDLNGNVIWSTIIGGVNNESVSGIVETENGDFCIAATTSSYGNGNNDLYLIWLSQNGTIIREKTYGGSESDGSTTILNSNTDLIVLGYTNSWGAGGQDYLVIK